MNNSAKKSSLYMMVLLNLLPVWGVYQWDWTPFMVFYMFWFETLIIAFFNATKMFLSRGDEVDGVYYSNFKKIRKSISYLLFRIGIFFFYLLFLVVFIGFKVGNKTTIDTEESGLSILMVMMFKDYHFNLAILGFIMFQGFQLIFEYILDNQYKIQKMNSYAIIFDGRQIVIHVAVVLSAFIGAFIDFGENFSKIGGVPIWYILAVLVFCIAKILMELVTQKSDSLYAALRTK